MGVPFQLPETTTHGPDTIVGGLNAVSIDKTNGTVTRTELPSQQRATTLDHIAFEYDEIGVTSAGVVPRLRDLRQQAEFTARLADYGVRTPHTEIDDAQGVLIAEYIPGLRLDDYLAYGNTEHVGAALTSQIHAHSHGVAIGDRWVKNTIIAEDGSVVEFDFDIDIEGSEGPHPAATTIDLAQTVFHMIHFAKDKAAVSGEISNWLGSVSRIDAMYDVDVLGTVLQGQANFFGQMLRYEGFDAVATKAVVERFITQWGLTPL